MKKIKNELLRLQNFIENDRLYLGEDFCGMIKSDVANLLKDYFYFKDEIYLNIVKNGDKLNVSFSLTADRIKMFGILPKRQ